MITRQNIKEVLSELTEKEIRQEIDKSGDYINVELHVFNAGSYVTIESVNLPSQEVIDAGNLSVDKDDFLRLLDETDNLPKYYR